MRPLRRTIPRTAAAKIRDPLGAYSEQFRQHLGGEHYRRATLDEYRRCLTTLGQQMKVLKVRLKDLYEERAVELIEQAGLRSSCRQQYRFIVRRFIQFLLPLGVVKPRPAA